MIKGHTKIELTNVKTGEKRVVEDDNLVTNAINKYFEFGPYENKFPNFIKSPLVDTFFGGLLLFQNTIEEKVDNYYLPNDNPMIGNAVVDYSSLDVPEFGAYNAEESSYAVEKGVVTRKYVYDFATSKGNGEISAVCLTNACMGYSGVGNRSGKRECKSTPSISLTTGSSLYSNFQAVNNYLNPTYIFSKDVSKPIGSRFVLLTFDYLKNCAYYMSYDNIQYSSSYSNVHFKNGYLELYKVHFPFNKINPTLHTYDNFTIYDKIKIETPEIIKQLSDNIYVATITNSENIYLVMVEHNQGYISPNQAFYVWKIDKDLQTSEVITLKNLTSETMYLSSMFNRVVQVVDDYLVYGYKKIFKFNLKNLTDVAEVAFDSSVTGSNQQIQFIRGDGTTAYAVVEGSGYQDAVCYKVDLVNNRADIVNGCVTLSTTNYYERCNYSPILNNKNLFFEIQDEYNEIDDLFYFIRNPYTLSTINNLSEPVTKTSDMTMKITYTITSKIEPEEEE